LGALPAFSSSRSDVYNDLHASRVGSIAGGSVQLFADQPGSVRVGCGLEASGLLQAWRKASLHDDGEPIGIVVGTRRASRQVPFLSYRQSWPSQSNSKFAWNFPIDLCRTRQSSRFPPADARALPNLL